MDTEIREQPVLSRNNVFPFRLDLTRRNATTNRVEGASGLTVTGFIAATKGGAAITTPVTTVTLTEYASDDGAYAAELDGDVANDLLDLALDQYWACYRITGETMDIWAKIRVEEFRTAR
jgi:hypothetical protein